MSIRYALGVIVLSAGVLLASSALGDEPQAARSKHGEVENVGSTITGQALERIKEYGEEPLVRARDLLRTVYGNHRARIQEALRRNTVIKNAEKLTKTFGFRFLSFGLPIAEGGASMAGYASVGDYRGAAVSGINTAARGVVTAGGAGAAIWALGAAGFATAGPIGGAVGGVVGGVAAAVGYDAYLSESVNSAAEYLVGGEEPDYFKLAQANRREFLADKEHYLEVARQARREFLANQQKFDTLVQERAGPADAEYAGQNSAKTFLSAAPPETQAVLQQAPPDAQAKLAGVPLERLIPANCVVTCWASHANWPVVLHIQNNQVSAHTGESLRPGLSGSLTGQISEDGRVMECFWHLSGGGWSSETWTFRPDNRVDLSVTWHWIKPKPHSVHGTVTASWQIVQEK
jgi:hypothetical protein